MNLKRMFGASTLAAGIGVTGFFGVGLGTASAQPGPPCGPPNAPHCQGWPGDHRDDGHGGPNWWAPPVDWRYRGIDDARRDHQPFMWNGQRVEPIRAGYGDGWGFWFLGQWIGL